MSKSRSAKSNGVHLHRGIPEQLQGNTNIPIPWKFGWSFERQSSGAVVIQYVDPATNKVVARAEIPSSDWVKITSGVSLRNNDLLCREIMKVIHN